MYEAALVLCIICFPFPRAVEILSAGDLMGAEVTPPDASLRRPVWHAHSYSNFYLSKTLSSRERRRRRRTHADYMCEHTQVHMQSREADLGVPSSVAALATLRNYQFAYFAPPRLETGYRAEIFFVFRLVVLYHIRETRTFYCCPFLSK